MNAADLSNIAHDATITGLSAVVSGAKPPMKTVTYRFAMAPNGGPSAVELGKTTFYDRTWEEHHDAVRAAGGEFVSLILVGGFYELSMLEPQPITGIAAGAITVSGER